MAIISSFRQSVSSHDPTSVTWKIASFSLSTTQPFHKDTVIKQINNKVLFTFPDYDDVSQRCTFHLQFGTVSAKQRNNVTSNYTKVSKSLENLIIFIPKPQIRITIIYLSHSEFKIKRKIYLTFI